MAVRDLTINDFKDKLEMEGSPLDILAVVAEKAKEILKAKDKLQESSPSSKRSRKSKPCSEKNKPPPPLPEKFENRILEMARGKVLTPPTLVIQKFLFPTDVEKNNNRFNIPISQINARDDFLTDDEKRLLQTYFDADIDHNKKEKKKKKNINIDIENNNENKKKKKKRERKERRKKKYLEVKMIEPSLDLETVKLRQWDMEKPNGGKASCNYVINGNWFDIVTRNYLKEEMEVQLWCFRLDQELYFALVPLP